MKAIISGKLNRLQPELAYHFLTLHVDVHRFITIEAVKEKPVWAWKVANGRHRWESIH